MLVLRSLLFNTFFYANTILMLIVLIVPALLLPARATVWVAITWAKVSLWLMKVIVGTRYEVTGIENIPAGGIIVAAKHQSFWETFALLTVFTDPVYILKRELTWIPLFGWALLKSRMIPVDRGAKGRALAQITRRAHLELGRRGRQLIIFPEGTRRPPGAEPAYKFGVAHLYAELDVPCVPVALNSGLYWPRRQTIRRPGTVRISILPPIMPGLDKVAFHTELQRRVEAECERLLAVGRAEIGAQYDG